MRLEPPGRSARRRNGQENRLLPGWFQRKKGTFVEEVKLMLGVFLTAAFTITSPAFMDGGKIPSKFTCDSGQTSPSPALSWKDGPAGARSYVLIMDDPDVPMPGGFTHWVLADIPAGTKELPEGFQVGSLGVSANSGFRRPGYGGPARRPACITI